MKTIKQINHALRKYVIAHNYSYEPGDETCFQDFDLTCECDREDFLRGLSTVKLPFVTIPGDQNEVYLEDIKYLVDFATENEIDLQLYLEQDDYQDIYLELLEFGKDKSNSNCIEFQEFVKDYDGSKNSFVVNKPMLGLGALTSIIDFCINYNLNVCIYSMYDKDEEDEEKNNRITVEFQKYNIL